MAVRPVPLELGNQIPFFGKFRPRKSRKIRNGINVFLKFPFHRFDPEMTFQLRTGFDVFLPDMLEGTAESGMDHRVGDGEKFVGFRIVVPFRAG